MPWGRDTNIFRVCRLRKLDQHKQNIQFNKVKRRINEFTNKKSTYTNVWNNGQALYLTIWTIWEHDMQDDFKCRPFSLASNPVPSLQAWGAGREGGGEQHHHYRQAGDPGGGRNQAGVPPSFKGTITRDFRASRCIRALCVRSTHTRSANVKFSLLNGKRA